jgi:hypothetical protein
MNKYCNLDGTKKIKEDYPNIGIGFDRVEADIAAAQQEITGLKNLTYTGSEHDALVTAALVDADGEDFGPEGTATYLDGRLEKWENRVKPLDNGITNTPTIGIGYNLVRSTAKVPVAPEINFTGISYVNLLGKDGDCEDIAKWLYVNCSIALDSANKVFGQNGIKITLNNTYGGMYKPSPFDATKYYFASAYLKNGNITGGLILKKDSAGGGIDIFTSAVTGGTFERVGMVIQPSQIKQGDNLVIWSANGANAQYGYVDGVMLQEITAAEYALGASAMLIKYPYGESYVCLTNPSFENRRYNLVRNGNCEEGIGYWQPYDSHVTLSIENGKFKVVTTADGYYARQAIPVRANTNYYLAGNVSGNTRLSVYNDTETVLIKAGTGTFNTSSNTKIKILLENLAAGTGYADSIMLVEGTIAPTAYKSCDRKAYVLEGLFTQDDKVQIKNGKVSGLLLWKHKTLYGKDYDWQYWMDGTGCKEIVLTNAEMSKGISMQSVMVKHDGKILKSLGESGAVGSADQYRSWTPNNFVLLSIADTDSGWAENIPPNTNEVKANRNGWRALTYNGSGRYDIWANVTATNYHINKAAYPPGTVATVAMVTDGSANVMVDDISPFKIGDVVDIYGSAGNATVGNISGNVLILTSACPAGVPIGTIVVRHDNQSTHDILNYCQNNVAPGYNGDHLHYKLANPEPITDANVHIQGEPWDIVPGDNYITVDCGIVLGEVGNPQNNAGVNYDLNDLNFPASLLRNKVERILSINKNGTSDPKWGIASSGAYGKELAYIPVASFDPNATYTVDYQILKTLHAQSFGSLTLKYAQDLFTAYRGLALGLENKQQHNESLDDYGDLTKYEVIPVINPQAGYTYEGGAVYANVLIPFKVRKSVKPNVTPKLSFIYMPWGGGIVTNKFAMYAVTITRDYVRFVYKSADSAVIAGRADGIVFEFTSVIVDCGGKG